MSKSLSGAERRASSSELVSIAEMFGGEEGLRRPLNSWLDVHELLSDGLPAQAVENFRVFLAREPLHFDYDKIAVYIPLIFGMSQRTLERYRKQPHKTLGREQSGQVWQFAETLTKAADVLGSMEAAERWMRSPAMGLEQRTPLELMGTPAGVGLVTDLLTRMDYGVYS